MTTALLVMALLTTPTPAGTVDAAGRSGSCTSYSWKVPPSHIRVLRAHHRGSPVRKRVETFSFRRYVGLVMSSGAWGNRVRESSKVGAIAIKGWALWMICNHQPGYSWNGQRYDVRDGDQYLRPDVRPWSHIPVRTAQVVAITWPITLKKNGHHFRTGWSGGTGIDGWHANEDTVRRLALSGLGWRSIIRRIYSPNIRILGDWA